MHTFHDPTLVEVHDRVALGAVQWMLTGRADGIARVVPDLSIDVVWEPEDAHPFVAPRTVVGFEVPVIAGVTTVGLRFAPSVTRVQIDESWPGWRDGDRRGPRAAVARADLLGRALAEGGVRVHHDPLLAAVLDTSWGAGGSVDETADALGVSTRHLRRLVGERTGISPKHLHRCLRLRAFVESGATTVAQRAAAAGYFDQAHAAHDLRELAGATASTLSRHRLADSSKTRATM
jgi:AraC-like DNA-binding protein